MESCEVIEYDVDYILWNVRHSLLVATISLGITYT